jgi:Iap family predicted aminopeptidase
VKEIAKEAMDHLKHLCSVIGPRPIGSTANQEAAGYIQRVFEDLGLEVETQDLPCPAWEHSGTHLSLGGEALETGANPFSPPCDLAAPYLAIGTEAELETADLSGRIGVLYGDLTKGTGFSNRNGFYYPEDDEKIIKLLELKAPAALITVHSKMGKFEKLMRDWDFPIPSATVPAEAGLKLLPHTGEELRLVIKSRLSPGRFTNVVATKKGLKPERILLCAHFDTMSGSPGAIDNGSGVAVLLALAGALSQKDLPLGVEWIALNGEETGGVGDAEYLSRRGETLSRVLSVINVDGVGGRVGVNSVTALGGSQDFQHQVKASASQYPGMVWVDPWYESDHTAFFTPPPTPPRG